MKKSLRLIAMLLMLACLFACLMACNQQQEHHKPAPTDPEDTNNSDGGIVTTPGENDGTGNGGGNEEETTPGSEEKLPPLPDPVNFGNGDTPYTYKALVRTGTAGATHDQMLAWGNNYYHAIDFYCSQADSESDAISYAVYARNAKIEETFNVRIQQLAQNGDMAQQLKLYYMDAEKIDLTIILAKAAASAATQNLLSNLSGMTQLDLTHPSYDQNSIKELALGDRLYYLSGDMNVSTMEVCGPTLVNLEMYNDYIETFVEHFDNNPLYADIYSIVLSNKWTIDTMLEMCSLVNSDVDDSDGQMLGSQPGDLVGYFAYTGMGVYYFYGSGGRLTEIDEDGNPVLVIEKYNDLFDYLFSKFNVKTGDNASWLPTGYSGPRWTIFSSGRCLFTDMTMYDIRVQLYEASPFQYGILPNPTYEEGSDYNSVVNFTNCNHLWAIPSMTNDSSVAQQMMNIFAAYSNVNYNDSTMYAYYERTLYLNMATDAGSRRAMDTIKNSMVYDIALLYDWYGMGTYTLGELTVDYQGRYAGNVTNQSQINQLLQDTVAKLKNPQMTQ